MGGEKRSRRLLVRLLYLRKTLKKCHFIDVTTMKCRVFSYMLILANTCLQEYAQSFFRQKKQKELLYKEKVAFRVSVVSVKN